MRPVTLEQAKKYEVGYYGVKYRVNIADSVGQLVDFTDFVGRDWIKSIRINADQNSPVNSCTVVMKRQFFDYNLSPFVDDSCVNDPQPAVCVNRKITIEAALLNDIEKDDNYETIFSGNIDSVNPSGDGNDMQIFARDDCGIMQDLFLESDLVVAAANPIETVIQTLINTVYTNMYTLGGLTPTLIPTPTLFTPTSPGFVLNPFTYTPGTLFEIINNLARQIGWSVKCRYDPEDLEYKVTLVNPNREAGAPSYTFTKEQVLGVTQAELSKVNVRNAIDIGYVDTGLGPNTIRVQDSDSIQKFGYRYMRIDEDNTSAIDTVAEATDMANRALSDLADPDGAFTVLTRFFPNIQEGDYLTIGGNKFFDSITAAVNSYVHTLTPEMQTTEFRMQGKPSIGQRFWLLTQEGV